LQPWPLLRKALIRAAKTSHTSGTLGDIFPDNKIKMAVFFTKSDVHLETESDSAAIRRCLMA
jgi:hypothetical protein